MRDPGNEVGGDLELEIEDGYNPLPVLSEFEQKLYDDLFF